MSAKTVLCFGDSNTHGSMPVKHRGFKDRYPDDQRWPSVMGQRLGPGWTVINEGQPGRTTVLDDPIEGPHKNGSRALPILLETHRPIDFVIIMLGTNDLKRRFSIGAYEIAQGVEKLIVSTRAAAAGPNGGFPQLLVATPTPVVETGPLAEPYAGAQDESKRLAETFVAMGERANVEVIDLDPVAKVSLVDGIHFEPDALASIGHAVADKVIEMTA
ncbi:MAG: SGNH/GDSL hydrolase family protein [Pseudomonadota bacterium]